MPLQPPLYTEHIFELRYTPNPAILDHRGRLAQSVAAHLKLPTWEIGDNRADIYTEDKNTQVFISFRNSGVQLQDRKSWKEFVELAQSFLRHTMALAPFSGSAPVERIGVRSKFATPFEGTFDQLLALFNARYVSIHPGALAAWGNPSVDDVGVPLHLRDATGTFNTIVGPVRKEEFKKYFRQRESFPPVGLFTDIDYWVKPNELLKAEAIASRVDAFAQAAWQKNDSFRSYLLED